MSTIEDCVRFMHCNACYEEKVHRPVSVGITLANELIVNCPEHGFVFSAQVILSPEVQAMKCAECGQPFDGKEHMH